MNRVFHDNQIRQYLLGELPEPDEGALEEAYFRDSDLLARVELARDDLADDYAAAMLSPTDREKFERRLLTTEEGREQLAIARALQRAETGAVETQRKAAWRTDTRWLGLAAAVVIAIGALLTWRVMSGPSGERRQASVQPGVQPTPQVQTPPPDVPRNPQSPPASSAITLATLVLTADLERSQGVPPTLLTPTGATHVDLSVPRTGLTPGQARARIDSVEGVSIWSGSVEVPPSDAPVPLPRVRVPMSALPPGDYLLSIESVTTTTATGGLRYYFRVRAQ
jgi:hypothetical protein